VLVSSHRIDSLEGAARLWLEDVWTPVAFMRTQSGGTAVVWADIGHGPFEAPFFSATLEKRLASAPWFLAGIESLTVYALRRPGLPLTGIVWHMSRCGSTLARNLLAAVGGSVAISEPAIVNSFVKQCMTGGHTAESTGALRAALGSFVRADGDRLSHAYLKCTSWNVLIAKTMVECAQSAPGIFVHRDPVVVLASIVRGAPGWNRPESFLIGRYGIAPSADPLERTANILAAYLRAALDAQAHGICRLVAYSEIVDRFLDGDLPAYFGYEVDAPARERMLAATREHSKQPGTKFIPDDERKRKHAESIPGLRKLCDRVFGDLYSEVLLKSQASEGFEASPR